MKTMHRKKANGRVEGLASRGSMLAVSVLTGLVASSFSPFAAAETNVEIYGIIDVGLMYQSRTATTATNPGGDSKTSMETSGLRQSILGFRGNRDLRDGLTGFFNLEAHFDTNTGYFHPGGDASGSGFSLFRRQANVGFSGDWGSLTLGRQYGPALLAHIGTEPRAFKEQFSNLYAWAYNQYAATSGAVGFDRNTNNDVGIFFNNAIQYRHKFSGIEYGILVAPGGQAGSSTNNSAVAFGASYTGPVTLSASYQVMKDQGTGNSNVKHGGLGIAVPFGDFTFKGNYLNAKNESRTGVAVSNVDALGVGVDWKWHPDNTMTIAYYDNKDRNNSSDHTRNWVLSNDYALRKDTTLYAQMAVVDADAGATIKTSIVAAGIPRANATSVLLNVGVNFSF